MPGVHVFVGPTPDPVPEVEIGYADESLDLDRGFDVGGDGHGNGTDSTTGSTDSVGESSRVGSCVPARRFEIARWLYEELRPEPGESGPEWCRRAKEALGDHEHGVCIHRSARDGRKAGVGYRSESREGATTPTRIETRSAASFVIDGAGTMEYTHADGPPCTTPFRPVTVFS